MMTMMTMLMMMMTMMMMMVVMMMVMMLVIMMIMMIMKTGKLLSNAQVDVQLGVQLQLDHYNVFLLVLKRFHFVQNAHNAYDYSAYTDDSCSDNNDDDCSDDNADDCRKEEPATLQGKRDEPLCVQNHRHPLEKKTLIMLRLL